jgi:hypothetical protein
MKTKPKLTMTELAASCGVHFDTIYKAKRKMQCSHRLATLLHQVTGIPRLEWLDTAKTDPWKRVLK